MGRSYLGCKTQLQLVMKRVTVAVSRDELRQHNREERRHRAEERRLKLLEACEVARHAASEQDGWLDQVAAAPVYRPTAQEWEDPLAYIRSIQGEAALYGICIVRAPVAPSAPAGMAALVTDPEAKFRFSTRSQAVRDTPWRDWSGISFHPGKRYSLREFQDAACAAAAKRFGGLHGCLPARSIEREYWREREPRDGAPLWVEYGNDVDGSLFLREDALGATRWNLNVLPCEPGSALRFCGGRPIAGVSTPMLYVGQLFSTFAWHVEDHFLYSINYQHLGASKTWYGVPASDADEFEAVARSTVYGAAAAELHGGDASEAEVWRHVERALMGKTTMFSPRLLVDSGVRVYRAVQEPGDYVLTFPRAYHAGFGNGFQVGEAVNFGMGDWWPFGEDARRRYRRMAYPAIIPHEQMLCDDALALATQRRRRQQEGQEPAEAQKQPEKQQQPQQAEEQQLKQEAEEAEAQQLAETQAQQQEGQQPLQQQQLPQQQAEQQQVEQQQQQGMAAAPHTPALEPEAAGANALAHTFVGHMRRLNHCRAKLEAAGAVPLAACPAGSAAAQQSLHCAECQQSCYAASAVVEPAGPPASWHHVCLECASAALAVQAPAAEGPDEAQLGGAVAGGAAAAAVGALLFVKPCWEELEACGHELEQGLEAPAATSLTLPLAGTTEQQRYGPPHEPGWPIPSEPYAWRQLQPPRAEWPALLLQSLQLAGPVPAAAPLAGENAAAEGAGGGRPAAAEAAVSPEQAFQVALRLEGEEEEEQQPEEEGDEKPPPSVPAGPRSGAAGRPTRTVVAAARGGMPRSQAAAAGAAPQATSLQQQQQQQQQQQDSEEVSELRLVHAAEVQAGEHRVMRHIYADAAGVHVLVGTEVVEAFQGEKLGRKDSAPRILTRLLSPMGRGVCKVHMEGRHQARAAVWQQDVAALLLSPKLEQEKRARLYHFIAGVWPEADAKVAASATAMAAPAAAAAGEGQPGMPTPSLLPPLAPPQQSHEAEDEAGVQYVQQEQGRPMQSSEERRQRRRSWSRQSLPQSPEAEGAAAVAAAVEEKEDAGASPSKRQCCSEGVVAQPQLPHWEVQQQALAVAQQQQQQGEAQSPRWELQQATAAAVQQQQAQDEEQSEEEQEEGEEQELQQQQQQEQQQGQEQQRRQRQLLVVMEQQARAWQQQLVIEQQARQQQLVIEQQAWQQQQQQQPMAPLPLALPQQPLVGYSPGFFNQVMGVSAPLMSAASALQQQQQRQAQQGPHTHVQPQQDRQLPAQLDASPAPAQQQQQQQQPDWGAMQWGQFSERALPQAELAASASQQPGFQGSLPGALTDVFSGSTLGPPPPLLPR